MSALPSADRRRPFAFRAMASVLIGLACVALVVTGAILFVTPPGRISNWSDWTILRLRKHDWIALHISFSLVFIIGVILHLVYNWHPMLEYFRNRLTHRLGFRREWVFALTICVLVFAGVLAWVPPFSSLMAVRQRAKQAWEKPMPEVSTNPARNIDEASGASPDGAVNLQWGQGGGYGRKTLVQVCSEEGVTVEEALARLQARGIKASENQTLREIANANGIDRPSAIVVMIRDQ